MAIRLYKPTSPARRFMSVLTYEEITAEEAREIADRDQEKDIPAAINRARSPSATRAAAPVCTTAGSTSSATRLDIPAKVAAIEYDPNRSAFIALLHYADGEKRYILAPEGLKPGNKVLIQLIDCRYHARERAAD